jgi:hypothetical protein
MIPVAAGILYLAFRISLSSEAAAIAMWFSSLSVVANSLVLNRFGGKWIGRIPIFPVMPPALDCAYLPSVSGSSNALLYNMIVT